MSDVEKIWAVSSGSYSDYSVLCICRTEEEAEQVAEQIGDKGSYHEAMVEEFMVITPPMPSLTVLDMRTSVGDDGEETGVSEPFEYPQWPFSSAQHPALTWEWVRYESGNWPGGHHWKGGQLHVYGTDHERVRKVYSDRRAMLLTDPAMRAVENAGGSK